MILVLFIGISFQALAGSLTIIGTPGPELSDHDVLAIKRLSLSEGERPWLFNGVRGQYGLSQFVRVFCSPTERTKMVRRGPLVHISRRRSEGQSDEWTPWSLSGSEIYAQVKLDGREFDDVKDTEDPNRPFSVKGEFSNQALVAIVALVRSSPTYVAPGSRPVEGEISLQVNGKLPIWYIHRKKGNTVEVNLLDGPSRGQTLHLKLAQGKWTVSRVGSWVS